MNVSNTNVTYLDYSQNLLTQPAVDYILLSLYELGKNAGYCDLTGGTNASPSAAGLISKGLLELDGWSVYVN